MRRQLRHLQELAEYPNLNIRVVPFGEGIYPYQRVPYILLEFSDPEDGIVLYVENPYGEYIIRETSPEEEERYSPVAYMEVFFHVERVTSRETTLHLLQDAINGLTAPN